MLTTGTFLAVFFGTLGLFLALFIPFCLLPLMKDLAIIRDAVKPIQQFSDEINRIGIQKFVGSLAKETKHHSLPPEKEQRKQELLNKSQSYGLIPNEAEELKRLLNEDATSDFTNGLIGAIALIGTIALIGVVIDNLTKKS